MPSLFRPALLTLLLAAFASPATGQGTASLIADLDPGPAGSSPLSFSEIDGNLYFTSILPETGRELFVHDPAAGTTVLAADIRPGTVGSSPADLTVFDGRLYFSASTDATGFELFVYDPATETASLVADLTPGAANGAPSGFTALGGRLYFSATTPATGYELFVYDPATGSVTLAADIRAGSNSSLPSDFEVLGDRLYFRATLPARGTELFVYDPATGAASLAVDIEPGSGNSSPTELTTIGDRLYFRAFSGSSGAELFVYNATLGVAEMIADVEPGAESSFPVGLAEYDGLLYFSTISAGTRDDFWTYDLNTKLVASADVVTGTGISLDGFTKVWIDGRLYFRGTTPETGSEIFVHDPATNVTQLAAEVNPGPESSAPNSITGIGDRLYVTGYTEETGYEPFVIVPSPSSLEIAIDGPAGFRFLGAPTDGLTVDDLAAQALVRGVPGYRPAISPNLWTRYDAATSTWVASDGTGEVLQPGHAFRWFLAGDPATGDIADPFTLSADPPAHTTPVEVTLDTAGDRYNVLANPFGRPLDLSTLASWPGSRNVVPVTWAYDPATRGWIANPGVIAPWVGFRVRARIPRANGAPRTLQIPTDAARGRTDARPRSEAALAFTLTGTTPDGTPLADRALTLVFSEDARATFDADEDARKFQVPAERYALIGARTGDAFVGYDVRPFADAEIPLAIEARGTAATVTLAWDASALPDGLPAVLVDLVTGAETDVRAQSAVTIEVAPLAAHTEVPETDLADGTEATDRFVLRIGTPRLSAQATISEVALTGIAPNPSAGEARVTFAVPEAGPVRLTVLDVRGRAVATLADGPMAAGPHEARLSGALAAGVYVVRLEAAGTVVTRQAVVVR